MTAQREAERNQRVKESGLCRKCKSRPASCGARCLECKQAALKRDEALRAAGLCVKCKQPAKKGHPRCSKCLESDRVRVRLRNRARRASGVCAECPKPSQRYLCDECYDKRRPYHKERRAAYIAVGMCPACVVRPAEINRTYCTECLASQRDYSRRRHSDPALLEQKRRDTKALRQGRIDRGECPRCGKPAEDGFKHCGECRGVMRAKANIAAATRRKLREQRAKEAAHQAVLAAREQRRRAQNGEFD